MPIVVSMTSYIHTWLDILL